MAGQFSFEVICELGLSTDGTLLQTPHCPRTAIFFGQFKRSMELNATSVCPVPCLCCISFSAGLNVQSAGVALLLNITAVPQACKDLIFWHLIYELRRRTCQMFLNPEEGGSVMHDSASARDRGRPCIWIMSAI